MQNGKFSQEEKVEVLYVWIPKRKREKINGVLQTKRRDRERGTKNKKKKVQLKCFQSELTINALPKFKYISFMWMIRIINYDIYKKNNSVEKNYVFL